MNLAKLFTIDKTLLADAQIIGKLHETIESEYDRERELHARRQLVLMRAAIDHAALYQHPSVLNEAYILFGATWNMLHYKRLLTHYVRDFLPLVAKQHVETR